MRRLSILATAAAALGLAACGSDGHPGPAPGSPERPMIATTPEPPVESPSGSSTGRSNEAAAPAAKVKGHAKDRHAGGDAEAAAGEPSYNGLLQQQRSAKTTGHRFTPCNLVSESQAAAILGGPVRQPLLAPQGPTCIYRSQTGSSFVTVAVQVARFERLARRLRGARRLTVGGLAASCGRYGQPTLYLELSARRVLTIAAPCPVATRFATTAVRQLPR